MHLDPIDGVHWYLFGDAPKRTASCALSDNFAACDDETATLSAFYDDFLPLYDRDAASTPRAGLPPPIVEASIMPALKPEPWLSAAAISSHLRKARPALRPPCAGQCQSPLSTISSVMRPV